MRMMKTSMFWSLSCSWVVVTMSFSCSLVMWVVLTLVVVVPVMVTVAVLVMVPMVMLVVVMLVVLVTMVECSVCFASPMLPELLRHVRHPHVLTKM